MRKIIRVHIILALSVFAIASSLFANILVLHGDSNNEKIKSNHSYNYLYQKADDDDDDAQIKFIVVSDNVPVKNAKVHLDGYGAKYTNNEGITIFEDVEPTDSLYYFIDHQGYEKFSDSVAVHGTNVQELIELKMLTGKVEFMVKSSGKPIPNAQVYLEGYGKQMTNEEGRAVFDTVENANNIYYNVSALNYEFYEDSVKVMNNTVEVVKLKLIAYSVKFIIKKGDEAISGAKVWLSGHDEKLTNEEGVVLFDSVVPGYGIQYTVMVAGYSQLLSAVNVIDKDIIEIVEFSKPTYSVFFRVRANGHNIEDARVELEGYGKEKTNSNGECFFRNVEIEENIPYNVETELFPDYKGTVTVTDAEVYEEVILTNLNSRMTSLINLHPIPSGNNIYFNLPVDSNISIFDVEAHLIYRRFVKNGNAVINTTGIKNGVYLFNIDKLDFSQYIVIHH